jgi:putative acetyltransferase
MLLQLVGEQQAELCALDDWVTYPLPGTVEYLVGYLGGRPMACGGLRHLTDGVAEIKRMYVRPAYRGQGFSRLILAALEDRATVRGYHVTRLETGAHLTAALGLCKSAGYQQIPTYGEYVGNPLSVCFEKLLEPALAS